MELALVCLVLALAVIAAMLTSRRTGTEDWDSLFRPDLAERLNNHRPEVSQRPPPRRQPINAGRSSSARARADPLDVFPPLAEAFLERRVAPTNIVNNALRRIGDEAAPVFERGVVSSDPIVRISSCFGLSGIAGQHGAVAVRLSQVLASDSDTRVRAAAAAALGIVGGGNAPAELIRAATDPDVQVRRSALKALGSFDDPTTGETLLAGTEDEDREAAIRAAEALLVLADRPRAAPEARAQLESSSAWAVEYARKVAEVTA